MIITVLWEDQRGIVGKGFGPDALLRACLRDLNLPDGQISSVPNKGNGAVIKALKEDYARLSKSGPVFAVLDSDRMHVFWHKNPPTACKKAWGERIVAECRQQIETEAALSQKQVVFLVENVESLIDHCLTARGKTPLDRKPRPDERDQHLGAVAWGTTEMRAEVLELCPSFARLVDLVAVELRSNVVP